MELATLPKFSPVASPRMSAAYVHIDTNEFIRSMSEEGFHPVAVKFDHALRRDPKFIRHMVTFEHADTASFPRADVRPRILFVNSHNGTVRAAVHAGLIRFACLNGLVIGDHMSSLSTRHIGDEARALIARAADLARNTTPLFAQIEAWERMELTEERALQFAERAAVLRWDEKAKSYSAPELLMPRRKEDEGRSLWRVFNRIQENATRGGFEGRSAANRRLIARPLSGITSDLAFNRGLWELAAEIAEE